MLQKNRYKISNIKSNRIKLRILQRLCYCYYYPEPDCCTGTVNISSLCVCACARVCVGGGKGSLYSCIDWEPVILLQTSPTKDAWKIHTDVLPPLWMCDSSIANFEATMHQYNTSGFRQTDCDPISTDYIRIYIQSGARGWGEVVVPYIYHMVRWCIHSHG